jgi:hypothetical protein
MDGRISNEPTPEGRLAAVAYSVMVQMRDHEKKEADYADYRDCMRPFVQRELVLAMMRFLPRLTGTDLTTSTAELAKALLEANVDILRMSDRFHLL